MKEKRRYFKIKAGRKILSIILTVAIVASNMTAAFAWSWDDKDNGYNKSYNGPYSHVSIAVGTENNGEWQLAEKPTIYTEVEETYCTKCEEGKKHKVCNSEGKRTVNKEIALGNKQNSNNNGTEYQSDMSYSFETDTVFTVTAKFTNGTKTTDIQTFTISNVENYKDSGLTFYQYCCKNYCDNHTGIDMKLSYEELVAHFYDVQYVVDGNVSTEITDGNDYEAGDEVTVTEAVPSKEGYRFDGWTLNDDTETLYQADDKVEMVKGGLTFEAQWTKLTSAKTFTVEFLDNDGTVLSNEKYDYGTQITVPDNPKKDDLIIDGDEATQTPAKWYKFNFNGWNASGDYTTDSSVTQDMTFTAEYNRIEVVVKYYVLDAGLPQPSELAHYPIENYSKGVVGSIYHFTEIANNDDSLAANLANVPEISEFTLEDVDGNVYTLSEGQTIKWYVIKQEADNWHVDGIVTNQMYTVTVNYLEKDTDKVLAESTTQSVAAGTEYTAKADMIEGYVLSSDKAEVTGTMPYDNITVNFFYVAKEETTTEEATTEEATTEEATTEEATTEEVTTEEATTEEATTEEATTEEATTEEATTEEVTTEEATTEEVTTEEATTEEAMTEETTTEEPTTEEAMTEEAMTEETTTEEATTEETATEDETDEVIPLEGGNPKTGDSSSNAGYLAALFSAVLAGIASVFGRKK